ncbi:hypothetical protein [Armatimonas rosea]|uniref:Uncharacterized protein n=1 Tax=Armatimonas rosea TaxID=685828 RepID=A0A7W9W5N5_ARMRO|nr:hypothetical protein [Armatimonas rosea]MBB6049246.1 hypothetical protein [Armatimonas rosea]
MPRPQPSRTPSLFCEKAYNAAVLAEAVNYFVALGERRAATELAQLAPQAFDPKTPLEVRVARGFERHDRVGWVLRILFLPKKAYPLREPRYGGLSLPTLTMPPARWPLYPVVASGSSYFVLSEGYMLGGSPEDPLKYLRYCQTEGRFRTQPVPVPTREQALQDVLAVRQSEAWKDSAPGRRYTMHEGAVYDYLKAQADSIPT